jgi:hypothetical protein
VGSRSEGKAVGYTSVPRKLRTKEDCRWKPAWSNGCLLEEEGLNKTIMAIVMDLILSILADLSRARLTYTRRVQIPAMYQFLRNEEAYISLLREISRMPSGDRLGTELIRQMISVVSGGDNLTDVSVLASPAQIAASILPSGPTTNACPICMAVLTEETGVKLRNCSHSFHRECLNQWFRRSVHCPVCRNDIRERPINQNNEHRGPHANA